MLILTTLRTQIKWILGLFLVVFVLAIPMMYGVGGSSDSGQQRSGDFAVASVNGEEVRISQIHERLRNYVERTGIKDITPEQMPVLYKAMLDEMVSSRAVIDEVTRLKISAPAEEVNKQLKLVEAQYVTKEAFMQQLAAQGSNIEQVKASIARELAISKMLDDVSGGVVVSDDEVAKFYDAIKNIPMFGLTSPAGVMVDFAQLSSKESAEKFIEDLKKDNDWAKAVELSSKDIAQATSADTPTRISDAEIAGKLEPIGSLKDGEISAPLEISSKDFFVVRRVKAVSADTVPLDEAKDSLKAYLLQQKKEEAQRAYVKELTDKMKVEILAPEVFEVKSADIAPAVSADSAPAASVSEDKAPAAEAKSSDAAPEKQN
ncbi:MAG: SurA N-terminal domain-containing protein [Pyramidobacter sp.]|nr:SurA N-terminal domain-containing protein [Pyramidobacter sp.]